jgi:hypothetical protein
MNSLENFESNEDKEFRHNLIQNEFRGIMVSDNYEMPENTAGVVILSAQEYVGITGEPIDYTIGFNLENKLRIESGIDIIKKSISKKLNKNIENVNKNDIILHSPELILDGTTEQLPFMKQTIIDLGFPLEKVKEIDCGKKGIGNTKTQFEAVNSYYSGKNPGHVTFISTGYHIPRVSRTGNTNFSKNIPFDVVSIPNEKYPLSVFRYVRGEVNKIDQYSKKGDISREA